MCPREETALLARPPTLSVIVPVYNDGQLLPECLDRLFQSSFQDFEVIVVDDGSTDTTVEIARSYEVQVIRMPSRSGPAAARNAGAGMARGEFWCSSTRTFSSILVR